MVEVTILTLFGSKLSFTAKDSTAQVWARLYSTVEKIEARKTYCVYFILQDKSKHGGLFHAIDVASRCRVASAVPTDSDSSHFKTRFLPCWVDYQLIPWETARALWYLNPAKIGHQWRLLHKSVLLASNSIVARYIFTLQIKPDSGWGW